MVSSDEEMEALVQRAVYPPRGKRSFGPTMAPFADLDPTATSATYLTHTSQKTAVIPMIESVEGLKNVEKICSIDGVTAVFVGPLDLRFSMGLPGADGAEEDFLEALRRIVSVCKSLEKSVGIFAVNGKACQKRKLEGFDFILVCSTCDTNI